MLRRAVVVSAALLVALNSPSAAYAGVIAGGADSTTASSGAWGATPAATTVTSVPPCLNSPSSCTAFTANGSGPSYLNIWNTGVVTLTGLSYTITLPGGLNPTITLSSCSVAWTQSTDKCAGTMTRLLNKKAAGTYPVTISVPSSPTSETYLQATAAGSPTSITIATSVCSGGTGCTDGTTTSQIRSATNINR
jgi:hypothetical protein